MEECYKFKTISQDATAEIIEKKSKFIANIFYIENVDEAENKIKEIKQKYKDASHNCFAYAIEAGQGSVAVKYNDDGEPQGTAGSPILKMILEKGLSNVLVIVTRYFGGTLLGTGGLVRAYTGAAEKAIENTSILEKSKGHLARIQVEYNYLEPLKYFLERNGVKIVKIEYLDKIEIVVEILEDLSRRLQNNYTEKNFIISNYTIIEEKFVEI